MLYGLLKICASFFFNAFNLLLRGNLPPFGSATVIVERDGYYLVIEHPRRRLTFPGGFMRWHEQPSVSAQREGKEETGLDLHIGELVNVYTTATKSWFAMSTINFVYMGEVVGGSLRRNKEGHPQWIAEDELRRRLTPYACRILDEYQRRRDGNPASTNLQPVS
jgi:ADP-ribose pyrophosphatase YjhB (NUDIX family)